MLALDYGQRRIGLAVSDPLRITAQGLETLERKNIRTDIQHLRQLIAARNVTVILMGHPLHMSGRPGRQAAHVEEFARRLESETGLPVILWDERLTSAHAHRLLREGGVKTRKQAGVVDRVAAVLLLENYLAATARQEVSASG